MDGGNSTAQRSTAPTPEPLWKAYPLDNAPGGAERSPNDQARAPGGFVGVHGTARPDLIPGRVSHGCIRMRNADVLRLARLMPVGTPLTIR